MFAYTPLISGDLAQVMQIGFFALFGIYATNALIQWYSEGPIGLISAAFLLVGATGAYWPLAWAPNVVGAAIIIAVIVNSSRKVPAKQAALCRE